MSQFSTTASASHSPLARSAWLVVGLLWIVALLNYLDRQLITTMGTPIKAELHIADADFGAFSSIFLIVYGVLSPLAGFVADRVGKRRVIVASLLVWSLVTWLTGQVQTFNQMLLARALMGISEAFYIPAAVALIVDYHHGPTRSRATGLHLSGAYAGSILGGLGGWIAHQHGWRTGFNLFGIVGVIYALIIAFLLPRPTRDHQLSRSPAARSDSGAPLRIGPTLAALVCTRGFQLLLLINALAGATFWTMKSWLPQFFEHELHVTQSRAGIYGASAFQIAAFIGMLLAGTLADRLSAANPRARALIPGIIFCIAAPCFFAIGFVQAVPLALAVIFCAGVAQGSLDANLMPALCTVADARHRATGYGLLNLVSTLTGGIMTYLGGLLKDHQIPFTQTFQYASILILMAGLVFFRVKPTRT